MLSLSQHAKLSLTKMPAVSEPTCQHAHVQGIKLSLSQHAEADVAPYTVEPRSAIIKGGANAKFTVRFSSQRAAQHCGFLHGVQKVFSPEVPLSLRTWPAGEGGESLGVMLAGTFHPYAGQPPAPLQPLRVDLSATRWVLGTCGCSRVGVHVWVFRCEAVRR